MSDYFILTKNGNSDIGNDESNQIIYVKDKIYILPKNNINYYIRNGLFEKGLIDWCKQFCNKDKNILDIGAHSGTYTISLAEYCNKVYAFEPQKMTFYSLCGSVALSNIKNANCLNYGLGTAEQVGIQKLNIVSLDGGGSTLHIDNQTSILYTEDVEIRTLDSFNIDNISFIKMDVENNELQVLLASEDTLRRSNYPKIFFEMNQTNADLISFLDKLNYKIIQVSGCNNMFLAVNKFNT
jgi:FkbM family methyltransferase